MRKRISVFKLKRIFPLSWKKCECCDFHFKFEGKALYQWSSVRGCWSLSRHFCGQCEVNISGHSVEFFNPVAQKLKADIKQSSLPPREE